MKINQEIRKYIQDSILCWLATASKNGLPNVSPKEIFSIYQDDQIIIANIASPGSQKNIEENGFACVSFIDILVQKGFQIKGSASVINKANKEFKEMESILLLMTGGDFPFKTIFQIKIESIKPIIAPKYRILPETTEKDQIQSAKIAYGFHVK